MVGWLANNVFPNWALSKFIGELAVAQLNTTPPAWGLPDLRNAVSTSFVEARQSRSVRIHAEVVNIIDGAQGEE
jgi:hypothetical protein